MSFVAALVLATSCLTGEPDWVLVPAKGAGAVPLNVQLQVWGYTSRVKSDTWELRAASGETVPLEVKRRVVGSRRLLVLKPAALLGPRVDYAVFLEGKQVSMFTTGDALDETAPAAPVLTGTKLVGGFGDPSSWNVHAQLAQFSWLLQGKESPDAAAYLVTVGPDAQVLWTEKGLPQLFSGACASNFPEMVDPKAFTVTVEAVDLAGNTSEPVKLLVQAPPAPAPKWPLYAAATAVIAVVAAAMARRRKKKAPSPLAGRGPG